VQAALEEYIQLRETGQEKPGIQVDLMEDFRDNNRLSFGRS
jgi:hypothetical protein